MTTKTFKLFQNIFYFLLTIVKYKSIMQNDKYNCHLDKISCQNGGAM